MSSITGSWNHTNPNLPSLLPGWTVSDVLPCVSGVWMEIFCLFDYLSGGTNIIVDGDNVTEVPVWVTAL